MRSLPAKRGNIRNGIFRRPQSSLAILKAPPIDSAFADTLLSSILPWTCPGCGAYTQTLNPDDAGFYSTTRKPVKAFSKARQATVRSKSIEEAQTFDKVIADVNPSMLQSLGLDDASGHDGGYTILPATHSSYILRASQNP